MVVSASVHNKYISTLQNETVKWSLSVIPLSLRPVSFRLISCNKTTPFTRRVFNDDNVVRYRPLQHLLLLLPTVLLFDLLTMLVGFVEDFLPMSF